MGKMDEVIVVSLRDKVFNQEKLAFQGVLTDNKAAMEILGNMSMDIQSMRRGDAEEDPSYKQPIPYAVVTRGKEIYVYERLQGAGEERLHNQLSIGVGGHMNPHPLVSFSELISLNLTREIEEEIKIAGLINEVNFIGLINDDSNEVGEVHLGILCEIKLDKEANVSVKETDALAGQWITLEELKKEETYNRLESWSKFAIEALSTQE